ncbi:MAG: RNA methyltransferase [Clostridiales bacterium]|jgi:TrmH family RNA methyltransferase|nr:RNA methyltransferase [Clostridiales bacterium]
MQFVSTKSALIKKVSSLKQKKYRDSLQLFIVEGKIGVKEAVLFCAEKIVCILASQDFAIQHKAFLDDIDNKLVNIVENSVFCTVSDTINSQGVLAVVKKFEYTMPDISYLAKNQRLCLYLDGIRDPGNLGTILRTAAATGIDTVFLHSCVDFYNSKVVRSATSAIFYLKIFLEVDIGLISNFYKIVCADVKGSNFFKTKLIDSNYCLVIGNEANGISQRVLDCADYTVSLPMKNIESLNASVAASVLLYCLQHAKFGS